MGREGKRQMNCPKCGGSGEVQCDRDTGALMRQRRCYSGVTQKDLAKRMRVSTAYLCDLELGRRHWNNDLIDKYNKAL